MAWHECVNGNYALCFRIGNKRFRRSLKTSCKDDAVQHAATKSAAEIFVALLILFCLSLQRCSRTQQPCQDCLFPCVLFSA